MHDFGDRRPHEAGPEGLPPGPVRPCNIEAEQALLGAILSNNDVFPDASRIVSDHHFHDPIHQLLFRLIRDRIERHAIADPRTLKPFVDREPGFTELGGAGYLIKLQDAAIGVHACGHYAREIYQLAIRRRLIDLHHGLAEEARAPHPDVSVADLISRAERKLYAIGEQGEGELGFQSFLKTMTAAVAAAKTAMERPSGLSGLSTGFTDIDRKLGGLQKADLVIIAGRPGMGKTALATNIVHHVAGCHREDSDTHSGGCVGMFSLEMPAAQLAARILAAASRIPISRIRTGTIGRKEFQSYVNAARDLQSCPIFIDDSPALPIPQLAVRARRLKETQGLDLLVVDYLQLVQSSLTREGRVHQVAEITQGLKAIAKELDVPVVALSQLSRTVEGRDNRKPQLSDLRDSGSIEQDADIVMFVFRKEYYLEQEQPDDAEGAEHLKWERRMKDAAGRAELIIAKHRQGPTGTIPLSYESQFTRFGNAPQQGFSDPKVEGQ